MDISLKSLLPRFREEEVERVWKPEGMEDIKKPWPSRYNKASTHMNTETRQYVQGLYRSAPNGGQELNGWIDTQPIPNLEASSEHWQPFADDVSDGQHKARLMESSEVLCLIMLIQRLRKCFFTFIPCVYIMASCFVFSWDSCVWECVFLCLYVFLVLFLWLFFLLGFILLFQF